MEDDLVHPLIAIEDGHGARGSVRRRDRRAHDERRATLSGNHFGHVDDFPPPTATMTSNSPPASLLSLDMLLRLISPSKCQGPIRASIQRGVGTIEPLPQHLAHEAVPQGTGGFCQTSTHTGLLAQDNINALQIVANRTPKLSFRAPFFWPGYQARALAPSRTAPPSPAGPFRHIPCLTTEILKRPCGRCGRPGRRGLPNQT